MKLSIIIPYYKTYDLTKKLLDNLTKQLTDEVEVILVDDGCDEKRLEKYPIRVIHQENGGVSSARNKGIDKANGEYITFIDSDDDVSEDYITKILDKINTSDFDYCYFSWRAKGKLKGEYIIKDKPPSWNTSVWNCIYKRTLIGNKRFNKTKQISEDTDFNKEVRKGKKENIEDILYIYNSGREDSLTDLYSKGKIATERLEKRQVVVYRSFLSVIGGIETAVYNLCNSLKDIYDITFLYDTADGKQLSRLMKIVRCEKNEGQQIKCGVLILYGFNPHKVFKTVKADKVIQQICCDVKEVNYKYVHDEAITDFAADSKASAKQFMESYPQFKCGVLHNLFDLPKPKRVLRLMTASRLSWEKGYDRMKAMAKRMIEKDIPFIWTVFTNDRPNEEIDGFIFMKPRLNIIDYMAINDYGIQLSESESWGNTPTEFLEAGVPMVVTNWKSAKEQVEDNVNGFILGKDLSNLDEVIDKMYTSKLKFKYEPKYSIKEWTDIIGDLGEKKTTYKYDENLLLARVLKGSYYSEENIKAQKGDIIEIANEDRLDRLEELGYVERI